MRWIACLFVLVMGCPDAPAPAPKAQVRADTTAASRPVAASRPAAAPGSGEAGDPQVDALKPLPPLAGPPAQPPFQWAVATEQRCRYRLREVVDESLDGQLVAAQQALITYDAVVRPAPQKGLIFEVTVRHVRGLGRREDYTAKLDSDLAQDLLRVGGGADTLVLFDLVVPFALLNRTLRVTVESDGRLRSVDGGDAIRAALLDMLPPKPRSSAHHRARVSTLLDDRRLAAYLVPLVLVAPTPEPQRTTRDDAAYRADVLTNTRVQATGASVLWEQKQAFAPSKKASAVPVLPDAPGVKLVAGQARASVEQDPRQACFRQAGITETRKHRWSGQIDDGPAALDQQLTRTRLWVVSTPE